MYCNDKALLNTSSKAMVKLGQLISHPPYSPNLIHSDYYLFPNMNRWLKGKRFISNKEIIAEIEAYVSNSWTFRITESASKCWKNPISSERSICQKRLLSFKNPGTFQPCSIIRGCIKCKQDCAYSLEEIPFRGREYLRGNREEIENLSHDRRPRTNVTAEKIAGS